MELWKPTRRTILRAGGLIAAPAIIGRAMAQVPLTGAGRGAPGGGAPAATNQWNASDKSANVTLSGTPALVAANATPAANWSGVRATNSASSGKIVWEDTLNTSPGGEAIIGAFANSSMNLSSFNFVGQNNNGCGYDPNGGFIWLNGVNTNVTITGVSGDTITYAVDFTAQKLWVLVIHSGTAGNWNNSGTDNPSTGSGGFSFATIAAGPYFAATTLSFSASATTQQITSNFGQSAYAIASTAKAATIAGFGNW